MKSSSGATAEDLGRSTSHPCADDNAHDDINESPPVPIAQIAAQLDGLDGGKKSTKRQATLLPPETFEDAPPVPPSQAVSSFGEATEKKQQTNWSLVEVIDDVIAPVPSEFQDLSVTKRQDFVKEKEIVEKTSKIAVGSISSAENEEPSRQLSATSRHFPSISANTQNNDNAGNADGLAMTPPNQDRSEHRGIETQNQVENDNYRNNPPQNTFGVASSPTDDQSIIPHPNFYAVEATLVESSTRSNDQFPEPSAPSRATPVIAATIVNDDNDTSGSDDDPFIERPRPDPDPAAPLTPCWKKYQTPLLVGALIVISALIGSIVSIVLMSNNGSDPTTIPPQVQGTPPTSSPPASSLDSPLSPDSESTQTSSPSPAPGKFFTEITLAPTDDPTEKPTLRPTKQKPTVTNSPKESPPYLSPTPYNPVDNPSGITTFNPTLRKTTKKPVVNSSTTPPTRGIDVPEVALLMEPTGMPTLRSTSRKPTTIKLTFPPMAAQLVTEAPTSRPVSVIVDSQGQTNESSLLNCSNDNDCVSNYCAYDFFGSEASMVCCEGSSYTVYADYSSDWLTGGIKQFCRDRPVGTLCGETDELCASNACVRGICADSKISVGDSCDVDNDCISNKCGYGFFGSDASLVCCKGNSYSVYADYSDGWLTDGIKRFCQDQPIGTLCGETHEICASNACVGGICAESKISVGESCSIDNDCTSRQCGYDSFSPDASMVCCERNSHIVYVTYNDGWLTDDSEPFCEDQPAGTACGEEDEICASNACVGEMCAESKTLVGDSCGVDNDCISGKCGYDSFSPDASLVCCESNSHTVYVTYSDGWLIEGFRQFCADQPNGTVCMETDEICSSNACVGGKCAESKISVGESCGIDNDCISRKCAYDAFSPDASLVCCVSDHYSIYTFSGDGWTEGVKQFCRDQPVGTSCGVTDEICESIACVQGTCAAQKIGG